MEVFQPWFFQEIKLLGPSPSHDEMGHLILPKHERWEDINRLRPLLDYCDHLARSETSIPPNEVDLLTVHHGTILHLLCVGIDAWASGNWLAFDSWINYNNKKNKYGKSQRDEMLKEWATRVKNAQSDEIEETLRSGLFEIHGVYKKHFGLWRKFEEFLLSVPEPVIQILLDNYIIGSDEYVDEVETLWKNRDPQGNLQLIAEYLWNWRRNEFTHRARAERISKPDWFSLFGKVKHQSKADDSVRTKATWIVSSDIPEHILVRCMLLASIRETVFEDVARPHVRTYLRELVRRYCPLEEAAGYLQTIGLNLYD